MARRAEPRPLTSAEKVLAVLSLFTAAQPVWSPERAARQLGVSLATGYRYFTILVDGGLLERLQRNRYVLGPAIVELDRQVRAADPVLKLSQPVMDRLLRRIRQPATVLLCRYYREKVMCIHQETNRLGEPISSYERGVLLPLFRGATSKAILANLPPRTIANLWRDHRRDVAAAGLGPSYEDFKAALRDLRRDGVVVSANEVDPGRTGIAAPVFDGNGRVIGSLSVVLLTKPASPRTVPRLRAGVIGAAREIERIRDRRAGRRKPARATS